MNFENINYYHQKTKHSLKQLAPSMGYLDWANQPDPYRSYKNTKKIKLKLFSENEINEINIPASELYQINKNNKEISLDSISRFLQFSLALSTWKTYGDTSWALRMNPSSGNLHPTEAYLWIPQELKDKSLTAGIYHYNSYHHHLEQISTFENNLKISGFGLILTSIIWREAWKYGSRAFRYANHDIGHALACLKVSANLSSWDLKMFNNLTETTLENIMGFDKINWLEKEKESIDCLTWIDSKINKNEIKEYLINFPKNTKITQHYKTENINNLSSEIVDWEIIDKVLENSLYSKILEDKKDVFLDKEKNKTKKIINITKNSELSAYEVIKKRRSAQGYQKEKSQISAENFINILEKTLATNQIFDSLYEAKNIHLIIFVHNVIGLEKGLYLFIRDENQLTNLKKLISSKYLFLEKSKNLYLLERGDFSHIARGISCHQDIASKSAFALGMLARFKEKITINPVLYKHLFWESGVIGQIFYLEAEALGLRGTGIGCFFDDLMHDLLGLKDESYQNIYNFTVGYPTTDDRLKDREAYFFREK